MEVLGAVASGLTLVGLFKVCVEAFDVIQTARNQELDCRKLILRLNIEKCRLYTWGQAMGLADASQDDGSSQPSQNFMFEDLVREALEMVLLLFSDANKLEDIYGCKQEAQAGQLLLDPEADCIDKLAIAFKRFHIKGKISKQTSDLYQTAKWSIYDRKKFQLLVAEAKILVDGLQEITKCLSSLPQQRNLMTQAIGSIQDVRTHILIADVCEEDYPELSEVSARATENASLIPEYVQRIDEWKLEIGTSSTLEDPLQELESMTTTELKHRILQLMQRDFQAAVTGTVTGDALSGIEVRRTTPRDESEAPRTIRGPEVHLRSNRAMQILGPLCGAPAVYELLCRFPYADDNQLKTVQSICHSLPEALHDVNLLVSKAGFSSHGDNGPLAVATSLHAQSSWSFPESFQTPRTSPIYRYQPSSEEALSMFPEQPSVPNVWATASGYPVCTEPQQPADVDRGELARSANKSPFENSPGSTSTSRKLQLGDFQYYRKGLTTRCPTCDEGFHGDHELYRHNERHHSAFRKVWICENPPDKPGFLDTCKACRNGKTYGANYNAAAHLRRVHFNPGKSKRGVIRGENKPSMEVLEGYMSERFEHNVDYSDAWELKPDGEADGALRNPPKRLVMKLAPTFDSIAEHGSIFLPLHE